MTSKLDVSPAQNSSNALLDSKHEIKAEESETSSNEGPEWVYDNDKRQSTLIKPPKAKPKDKNRSYTVVNAPTKAKKNKPVVSTEVHQWLTSLALPTVIFEKYVALFADEEIFQISQIMGLKEHHLHDWMGVKTGTVMVMLDSIKKLKEQPEYYLQIISTPIAQAQPDPVEKPEKDKDKEKEKEKAKEKEIGFKPEKPEKTPKEKEEDKCKEKEKEKMVNEKIEKIEKKGEVYQAGGHGGVIVTAPGLVRKKTVAAEITFYKEFQTLGLDVIPEHIRTFFPQLESASKKSIIMEDLTYGSSKPCIMDVKMGTRTAGENANKIKKNFMISKDKATTTASYGLRIVAARTYNNTKGLWQALSRGDCNSIADHTSLESALGSFFLTGNEQPRLDVLEMYINRMEILKEWMEKQTSFRFYSSSLLFVYDGDNKSPLRADIRMIDFAHVHAITDGGIDEGYLKGLTNLLAFFKRYKKDCEKRTNKIIPDKSIYHVENPEESEYFEMRAKTQLNADSEESDEEEMEETFQHFVSTHGIITKAKKPIEKNLAFEVADTTELKKSDSINPELTQQTPREGSSPSTRDSGNEKTMQLELKKLRENPTTPTDHLDLNSPKNKSKASSRSDLKSDIQDMLHQSPENIGLSSVENCGSSQSLRSTPLNKPKEERITNKKQPKKESKEEKVRLDHTT